MRFVVSGKFEMFNFPEAPPLHEIWRDHAEYLQTRIDLYIKTDVIRCTTSSELVPDLAAGEAGVMAYNGLGCEWVTLPEPGFGLLLAVGVLMIIHLSRSTRR